MGSILIVEDDRTYARATANWLARNGLDARYVLSVDAAKTFLAENETGLVLSDFRLGEENGVELLEWMRKEGYRMPFFIMTGYADIPGAVEAVRKGAENYLPKPVQTEKVLGIIREALNRRKGGRPCGTDILYGQKPSGIEVTAVYPAGGSGGLVDGADTRRIRDGKGICGTTSTRIERTCRRPVHCCGLRCVT